MSQVFVGTSGWAYKSWENGAFYPKRWPKNRQFDFYATRFSTVEINLTYYRLPTLDMCARWRTQAPGGFVYAVKGSRFITHMKKLVNLEEGLDRFFERLEPMRARVGAVLWQLPPSLRKDLPRLESFFEQLPRGYRMAVEFRHPSWLDADVLNFLRRQNAAYVPVSSLRMPPHRESTSDFTYIRFHGLQGGFAHDYTDQELEPWAQFVFEEAAQGKRVYAYFNNDGYARAPLNAQRFLELMGCAQPKESLPELFAA